MLANLYLHHALDLWVERVVKPRCRDEGMEFIEGFNRRLVGHYNNYGLRGNSADLWRFYNAAVVYAFKWLNRRGGKRKSFTWATFGRAIEKLGIAKPRITESRGLQHELVFA